MPLRDAEAERILVELADASVREAPISLAAPASFLGPVAEAWARLLAAWGAWTARELDDPDPETETELRAAVRAFDDALAVAGLGYFVEARIRGKRGDQKAFLRTFLVEEVTLLSADDRTYAIPSLRQIDHVSIRQGAMGLESPDLGAIVIVDAIARYALTEVLPALARDAAFNLGTKGWQVTRTGTRMGKLAGEVVRRELLAALGADAAAAQTIAERLARRGALVAGWRVVMRKGGLYLPADELARVADKVAPAEHAEVLAIEDELERLEAPRILAALEALVAASVRRHELAHVVDRARTPPLPYPGLLEDVAGPDLEVGTSRVFRARGELVGYLSQLIDDPITPHLTLWGAATAAFSTDGSAEASAGTVILQGLAKQLDVDVEQRPDEDRRLYLTRLAEPLAGLDGPQLRRFALALWLELYDVPHVPVSDG
ncbi:MAG: hypothetical protein KIT31_07030 [Deltaproteobacteria bacterium]|nr:hypothetical protein [Deltaproteobacteria bacterium]